MDWLGDDFAEMPLEFDLLSAGNIVAAGKSQYVKVTFTN
jgi:DNA segregation ATPase FtsK/SpoIIIE-like protein